MSFATSPAAIHLSGARRVASDVDLHTGRPLPHVTWKFRPSGYAQPHYGDWVHDIDDYWWNRRYTSRPAYTSYRYFPNQRYCLKVYERDLISRGPMSHYYLTPYFWEAHYWNY